MKRRNEQYWLLTGALAGPAWYGRRRDSRRGRPCDVTFDHRIVYDREDRHGDVVGFLHTHPGMTASPSQTDLDTMRAWVLAMGKPLVCAILGRDGLRAHWFLDDEAEPVEAFTVRAGGYVLGLSPSANLASWRPGLRTP